MEALHIAAPQHIRPTHHAEALFFKGHIEQPDAGEE